MKKVFPYSIILWLGCSLFTLLYGQENISGRLSSLEEIVSIESLESSHYKEKYLLHIKQPLDHHQAVPDSFYQRVIVGHVGFDRPTVIVTEGYGGAYALQSRYREELSVLLDANLVFVEHRYFLESTPEPLNWDYLTAENAAYDLHRITGIMKRIYPGKWVSTGISKGGQTTLIYRAFFPGDVDVSVPYVAPLNRAVEDQRQSEFLKKVGTPEERKMIADFQKEILRRRDTMIPLLDEFSIEKGLTYRISLDEVLDFCVLEYPFALWQWGTPVSSIPGLAEEDGILFNHLADVCDPDYFSEQQQVGSFFVQAARELGYYPYDTEPLKEWLSIRSSEGYLHRIMLPESAGMIDFSDALYRKVYSYLRDNDPEMICIYGASDPWTATRVPDFPGKKNLQIYIQPGGSHRARINTMPDEMREKIILQLHDWLQ